MLKLLLGTNNYGKVYEYQSLLSSLPFKIVTLADQSITTIVNEDGANLEENARAKASVLAAESQLLTLADDSGLEVDALGGMPGVISARYAGEGASNKERITYLLAQLENVPWKRRMACFRCVVAIATPDGEAVFCSSVCRGFITLEPKGELGFGYDPIFYLPEIGKTMAELPAATKNQVSHRGQAARKARQILERLAAGGDIMEGNTHDWSF
ncbi:RdgB/HAM1 family non-canonical purine NTP pyrophosphatase [Chloroflexota bacterium]